MNRRQQTTQDMRNMRGNQNNQLRTNQNNIPNNNNRRRNVLFFSKSCMASNNLINLMKHEDLLKYFEMVCIDGIEDKIPTDITHVPALIVSDVPKPLMANDAFEWLRNIKYIRNQNKLDQNKKLIQSNMMQDIQMGGPLGFTSEMSGFSDNFAYKDIDIAQPKEFFDYKGQDKLANVIITPPKGKKITPAEQQKILKEADQQRQQQDKNFSDIMNANRVESLIKSEKEQMIIAKKMGLI